MASPVTADISSALATTLSRIRMTPLQPDPPLETGATATRIPSGLTPLTWPMMRLRTLSAVDMSASRKRAQRATGSRAAVFCSASARPESSVVDWPGGEVIVVVARLEADNTTRAVTIPAPKRTARRRPTRARTSRARVTPAEVTTRCSARLMPPLPSRRVRARGERPRCRKDEYTP